MRRKAFRCCTGLFMAAAMLAVSAFGGIFTQQIEASAEAAPAEDSFVYDFTAGGSQYTKEQIAEKYGEEYLPLYEDLIDQLAYATTSDADFGSSVDFVYLNTDSVIPSGVNYQTLYDNICEIVKVLMYDNPQFYWLAGRINTSVKGSTTSYTLTVSFTAADEFKSAESRLETNERLVEAITDFYDSMAGFKKDFFKAAVLNDRLCGETKYDTAGANDRRYSIDGCLLDHLCVCDGYAKTQCLMLNIFGIDTVKMSTNDHAWNAVLMDGAWYYTDVTFDDVIFNGSVDNDNSQFWRRYFLKSEATFDAIDTEDGGASQHLDVEPLYEKIDNPTISEEDYVYTDEVELMLPEELAGEQVTLKVSYPQAYIRPSTYALTDGVIDYQAIGDGEYTFTVYSDSTVARQYSVTVFGAAPTTELDLVLCRAGDTNGDAAINTRDITAIKSHLKCVKTLEGYSSTCADVSGDNVIDLTDVLLIKAYMKGLISL